MRKLNKKFCIICIISEAKFLQGVQQFCALHFAPTWKDTLTPPVILAMSGGGDKVRTIALEGGSKFFFKDVIIGDRQRRKYNPPPPPNKMLLRI